MRVLLAGLLLSASALPLAAHADTLDLFTLTGGGNTSTWTMPSVVNFTYHNEPQFVPNFPIVLTTNGVPTNTSVTFEFGHVANLIVGSWQFINSPSVLIPTLLSNNGTDSSYTGTFDLGSFSGFGLEVFNTSGETYVPYSLTIQQETPSPTPEPSSLLLLATGVLLVLPPLRRRLSAPRTGDC